MVQVSLQISGGKVVFLGGFHGTTLGHQREWKYLGHLSVKNLKLFSIRAIFEPIVLQRKGDGCLLFLKAFSWETNLLKNTKWFHSKKNRKVGNGNLYLTENRLNWNEM